jgi:hypothetical protein
VTNRLVPRARRSTGNDWATMFAFAAQMNTAAAPPTNRVARKSR